jgi:hypothetical protein
MIQKKIDQKKEEIAEQLQKEKEMDAKLQMTTSEQILYDKQRRMNRAANSVERHEDVVVPQKFDHKIYVNTR